MRILVIGGTGFIGSHVTRRLATGGHEVFVFHRVQASSPVPATVREVLGDRKQIRDHARSLKTLAPDVVLDMIPYTETDARDVVDVFRGIAGRLVAVSSGDVYRAYAVLLGHEAGPQDPVPLREDASIRKWRYPDRESAMDSTDSAFDYDKVLVEEVVMSNPDLPGTVLRLGQVYGPEDPLHRTSVILRLILDGTSAIVLDDSEARWRSTRAYCENAAEAIALAVTSPTATGRVYNIGESAPVSIHEWARRIGRAAGWDGSVVTASESGRSPTLQWGIPNPAQDLVLDSTRIREELRYRESIDLETAMQRTVDRERQHLSASPAS